MESLRIGISTQTPLLRFAAKPTQTVAATTGRRSVAYALEAGQPGAELNPGGVTRLVLPIVREWYRTGAIREAHWFSLQPNGPRSVHLRDPPIHLHHLALEPDELRSYGRVKEKLWNEIHGLPTRRFDVEDFRFYARYNWFTSDAIMEQSPNVDLVYVHDFQLLQVGALIGLSAPSVLQWHVPFDPVRIPEYTRLFLVRLMEDFDAVIVSTLRELHGLRKVGFQGLARQIYPHIDPADWPLPTDAQITAVNDQYGLAPDEPVVLCVARMDPMKRQDLLIRAFARLHRRHPRARLVFVGNGSFSGSRGAGLGIGKAEKWLNRLQKMVLDLKLGSRVVFTHWVPHATIAALYARASVVVLPSDVEGFGLTVLEAWRYEKATICSSGAGASEVVSPGVNGLVFPSGDEGALSALLDEALSSPDEAVAWGQEGHTNLRQFEVPRKARYLASVMDEAVDRYGGN